MASSALKEPIKTAYEITWTLKINVLHDSTKGRAIENLVSDIEDELLGEVGDLILDAFPGIADIEIERKNINLN